MSKFKFKLETVLKVRIRLEDLRKQELKVAEVRREQAKRQLLQRQQEAVETVNSYRNSCQQKLNLYVANHYHKYLLYQNKQVELADQHLQQCNGEVVKTRQRLVEASKEKKVVEKLKEKAYEAYKAEELHQEINFLDELGTNRFQRQDSDKGDS